VAAWWGERANRFGVLDGGKGCVVVS